MNNIKNKIEEILKEKNLTKKWLADKIEISVGNLNRTLSNISLEKLIKVAAALDLNVESLLNERYSYLNNVPIASDQESVEYQIPNDGTYRLVPVINSDAVGGMHKMNDISATDPEFIKGYIPFTDALEEDLCIPVTSDSMIPTCPPGCVVQIRQVVDWREYFGYGNLFVIQLKDGRRIIKEVTRCDTNPKDYILCISHNKSVPPEELPKSFIVSVWKVIKVLTDRGW